MPTMDTAARTYWFAAHHDWDSIPALRKSPGELVSMVTFSMAAGGSGTTLKAVSRILTGMGSRLAGGVEESEDRGLSSVSPPRDTSPAAAADTFDTAVATEDSPEAMARAGVGGSCAFAGRRTGSPRHLFSSQSTHNTRPSETGKPQAWHLRTFLRAGGTAIESDV